MNRVFKIFRLSFPIVISALLGVSCAEELEYVPGEKETDNSYGVYFPDNTSSTMVQISPDDRHEVTFKVRRTNVNDEITVPVEITASEDKIFIVDDIYFDEGQDETEFTIAFPKAKPDGTEYSLTVNIVDPQYVSIYSKRETAISLTVVVAEWVDLEVSGSKAKWRDDILSSMYIGLPTSHAEVDIEVGDIQERKDKPGMFRVKAYTPKMMQAIFGVPYVTENKYIVVDATDKDGKVWIPNQPIGVTLSPDDGFISIASYVDKQFSIDEADSMYGSYDRENKVITFPVGGVMCTLSKALAPGEWLTGNQSGMLRLMLPGATLQDYSARLKNLGQEGDGSLSVEVTLGKDAEKFVYKVFEGTLEDGTASLNAQDLADGVVAADGETAGGVISVGQNLKTGKYTLVGYTSDGEGMRDYAFLQFGFVEQGDDKSVRLVIGLEGTDELAGQGIDRNNSVKFYAYRDDSEEGQAEEITELSYWLYLTDKVGEDELDEQFEKNATRLTDEELKKVNDKEFSIHLKGLNGESSYTMMVKAGNGYLEEVFTKTYSTEGVFNPVMTEYYDFEDFLAIPDEAYFLDKTWHYYATDVYDRESVRKRVATDVYFRKGESGQIRMYGFTGLVFDKDKDGVSTEAGVPVTYDRKTGYLYMDFSDAALGYCEGKPVYLLALQEEEDKQAPAIGSRYAVIGRVYEKKDGYLYLSGNPDMVESKGTFSNVLVMKGNGFVHWFKEIMFVDASVDITEQ